MKHIEIGIIGGNGAMGKWFATFFRNNGYGIHIADKAAGMSLPELARRCAVVIVSVPIGETCDVIRKIGPCLTEDALLMDLASLKTASVQCMLKASQSEVIGLHPLFGPDVPAIQGQNMVICPARGNRWLLWLKDILEQNGASVVQTTPEKHDEMMAVIQGLTHINTILMGLCLKEAAPSPDELDRFSTPIFRAKLAMIDKVFDQNPRMYAEIIAGNPDVGKIVSIYEKSLATLKRLILNQDMDSLVELLESRRSSKD